MSATKRAWHFFLSSMTRASGALADLLQEPVLFNGTVFDNIVKGLIGTAWEDASTEEKKRRVQNAAELAFAHDFISDLAQGYDTPIGQRGSLLSGGQKQRIAIARSIISEPKILLLDEATSALDPQAEGIVQKALDNAARNRTTITIAHKLATIRDADNIVVMSHGRIAEQGTHEQLCSQGGLYEKLVRAQDLAPSSDAASNKTAVEDDSADCDLEPRLALTKTHTRETSELAALQAREDIESYKPLGFFRTIAKLVKLTPELRAWYILTLVTCVAGGTYTTRSDLSVLKAADLTKQPPSFPAKPSCWRRFSTRPRRPTWSRGATSSPSCSSSWASAASWPISSWAGRAT